MNLPTVNPAPAGIHLHDGPADSLKEYRLTHGVDITSSANPNLDANYVDTTFVAVPPGTSDAVVVTAINPAHRGIPISEVGYMGQAMLAPHPQGIHFRELH